MNPSLKILDYIQRSYLVKFFQDKNFSKNRLRKHMQAISMDVLLFLATGER